MSIFWGLVLSKNVGQLTLADLAYVVLLFAAFTSSWVAASTGSLQLVDVFIAASMPLVILHLLSLGRAATIPFWMKVGATTIALLVAIHIFAATSEAYMESRAVLANVEVSSSILSSAVPGLQWLVALLILPILVSVATGGDNKRVSILVHVWMLGVAVSSAVAVTDFAGLTTINYSLTEIVNAAGRESGLTIHPNNLGVSAAITLPVAVYYASRSKVWGPICVLVIAAGSFLSGSRASQVGAALAILLTAVLLRKFWRVTMRLVAWVAASAMVVQVTLPGVMAEALSLLRFSSDTAESSDFGREILSEQGVLDFLHRPVVGVGFEVANAAHSIYLQTLAAGGLMLAIGMAVYFIGALRESRQLAKTGNSLGWVIFASLLTWFALGAFSNQLTDRYLYFGIAALVALWSTRPRPHSPLQRRPAFKDSKAGANYGDKIRKVTAPANELTPRHAGPPVIGGPARW